MRLRAPPEFRHATLEHLDPVLAGLYTTIRKAAKRGHRCAVVLMGPTGTGKTHALAAYANALEEASILLGWVNLLANEIVVDDHPRVMFLDDLGREETAEARRAVRTCLTRYADEGGVIVASSNRAIDRDNPKKCALGGLYGEALRSRILGDAVLVEVNGDDRRFA